jgi:uncharacterized protein (TIGR00106 family)
MYRSNLLLKLMGGFLECDISILYFHYATMERNRKTGGMNMAIIDITVIPLGTETPSVSEYVVEIHKVLQKHEEKIKFQLTPMSTLIEGELKDLLEIVQEIHEVPFIKGIQRVCTNIRIDDRRDKEHTMERKLKAVQNKL